MVSWGRASMTLPSRTALLVTIALAVAVGGIGGLVAGLLVEPGPRPVASDASMETRKTDVTRHRRTRSERGAARERDDVHRTRRDPAGPAPRRTPRRGGTSDREDLARRVASPDPDVRFGAALDLMLAGPESLDTLRALDPPTDAGRKYVAEMISALDVFEQQRQSTRWSALPEDSRLELRLDALRAVIPEGYLAEQREEYWRAKAAADVERVESGGIEAGERRFAEAQLAAARAELGRIGEGEAAAQIRPGLDEIRKWVDSVKQSNRFVGQRWLRLKEELTTLERYGDPNR